MSAAAGRRRAGLLIPLFSCASSASWGIGDIADVEPATAWLADAGQRVLQLLPLNEMAPGQQSPYSAISAMAVDPIFISVPGVPEFARLSDDQALTANDRDALAYVRASDRIRYAEVRALKQRALSTAFNCFFESEWCHDGERAGELKAFIREQSWWIEDYAIFRAIHAGEHE